MTLAPVHPGLNGSDGAGGGSFSPPGVPVNPRPVQYVDGSPQPDFGVKVYLDGAWSVFWGDGCVDGFRGTGPVLSTVTGKAIVAKDRLDDDARSQIARACVSLARHIHRLE